LNEFLTWVGIGLCLSQSAVFSGLNLALFGISRLRLEVEDAAGNKNAAKILSWRRDSNFLLTTVLWGNVSVNVLLALLSDSVLTGIGAFVFSTVVITFAGEIVPQAYFSRNALRMATLLSPLLTAYRWILFPVAKPSALMLDWWLGKEGIQYFRERDLRTVIAKHIEANESDIDRLEGIGAMNFLELDDLLVSQEGEPVDPLSIIQLPTENHLPVFPHFERTPSDSFLQQVQSSGKKWVILVDLAGEPTLVLDSNAFLRRALFAPGAFDPYEYCHRPVVVRDAHVYLGSVISKFKVHAHHTADDVIDEDITLVWGVEKRVITGADILGRLLRGIATREILRARFPHPQ
jgi:metal transporter CNNM